MLEEKKFEKKRPAETIFADSLIETSWAQRIRRSWTTLTSFGVQVLAIGCLLLLPLWKTIGLPAVQRLSTPISLGRPSSEPIRRPQTAGHPAPQPNLNSIPFVAPGRVRPIVDMGPGDPSPAPIGAYVGDTGPGFPPGIGSGPPISIFSGSNPPLPVAPKPAARTFRTSSIMEGSLIRRLQPVYPSLARSVRVQGSVVLAAVISKAGTIENLRVVSGHPMLVQSAIDAVSQWRYRPYILNNEAIEVETQITVNFFLGGS